MQETIQGFRLSPQQRRSWDWKQRFPAGRAGCTVVLEGDLDRERLLAALDELQRRHEVLRTTFHRAPGVKVPIQVVREPSARAWPVSDLTAAGQEEREGRLAELVEETLRTAAGALEEGPMAAHLVRTGDRRHVLILGFSPLIADRRSLHGAVEEIAGLYAGGAGDGAGGGGLPTAEDLVQYLQFSEWQNELQDTEEGQEGRRFWTARRERPFREPVLPFAKPEEGAPEAERAGCASSFPAAGLGAAAASLGSSLEVLVLASWCALLWRLSGSPEVAVAAAFDGRSYPELASSLGAFGKRIPVACAASAQRRFSDLVRELDSQVTQLASWQDTFDSEGFPELGVHFDFEEGRQPVEAAGLRFAVDRLLCAVEPVHLGLVARHHDGRLALELSWDPAAVRAADARRLAAQLGKVLAAVAADPDLAVGDLDLLLDEERRQLVEGFNDTAREIPGRCLHELFDEQAARAPHAPAVSLGEEHLTYAELARRANGLALHLQKLGVGPEARVAVCLDRSTELVVSLLAVLKAGGAYVPLDPLFPANRIATLLDDAGATALLTRERFLPSLPDPGIPRVCVDAAEIEAKSEAAPVSGAGPANLAYILHTSGSTGRPKGVMVPHRGVVNYLTWAIAAYGLGPGSRVPLHSPLGFDLTVTSLWGPLLSGGCVVLIPEERGVEGLSTEIARGGAFGLVKLTPSHLELLSQLLPREAAGAGRVLVVGGEALVGESLDFWKANAADVRVVNEYGPTETVVGCSFHELRAGGAVPGPVSIGRPIANARIYLLDHRMRPVSTGVAGQLYVGGEGVARGYLGQPHLTADRFVPDPFAKSEGGRLYRTGDLARFLADGELEYLGRADEQVKIRGVRIEPGEVEAVLREHPAVREALVVAREDTPGDRRLVAYVVAAGELESGELRTLLDERLPEYMVPAAVIALPRLPLTPNGKVDRAALPAPDPSRVHARYEAPRTPVEEILAAIWPKVLGVDRVGIDDNFFALGGDSIRSVRAVALAKERGLESTVEQLFEHQTIRTLAGLVKTPETSSLSLVATRPFGLISEQDRAQLPPGAVDAYPLTSLQRGMLYHMEQTPENPLYHNVNSWHFRAPWHQETFEKAVREVVLRHPVLRTSFDFTSYGEPLQIVHRTSHLPLRVVDLRGLDAERQLTALQDFWQDESKAVFDTSRAPLLRFHIHRRSDESFQFTLTECHAIMDGWSTTSTLSEIFWLYLDLVNGRKPKVEPPLRTLFRDYVSMERMALESEECKGYWNRVLSQAEETPMPRWPEHLRRSTDQRFAKHYLEIEGAQLEDLRGLARTVVVPLRTALLAAHLKVMGFATGHGRVLTGVVTNGRPEQIDGDRVRGLFLNTVPFFFQLPQGSWFDLVRETFHAEKEMLPFRRYPLAALQARWGRRRLFDTGFTYLHFHSVEALLRSTEMEILEGDERDLSFNSFILNVTFFLSPTLPRMRVIFEYNAKEICPEQVEALAGCYSRVLEAMVADPAAPHGELSLFSPQEREQILSGWNRTDREVPLVPVHAAVARQAAATPDAPAVVCGGEALTYGELDRLAGRLAGDLRARGAGPESLVGIFLDRSAAMVVAVLGVLKAGAAYLPLETAHPAARLAWVLADARPAAVVTAPALAARLEGYAGPRIVLGEGWREAPGEAPAAAPAPDLDHLDHLDHLAYVIYTSGSTGDPKGVQVSHRGLAHYVAWSAEAYGAGEGEGSLVHSSLAFDLTVTGLFPPLVAGRKVELVPEELGLEGLATVLRGRSGLSLVKLTPAQLSLLARQVPEAEAAGRTRAFVIGGENLQSGALRFWREAAPETALINEYGPTEAVVGCAVYRMPAGLDLAGSVPIGTPIANARLYGVDEQLQPVPVGATGELLIGSVALARGYLGRPDLTAERFVPDPWSGEPGGRLYRTGDLVVRWADGNLVFVGRNDHQIKVRGYRVELGEVEAALVRQAGVREAAVLLRDDGPGEAALVAYVAPAPDAAPAPGPEELKSRLRLSLPEYMVPATFVFLDALPVTPNGKVDRRALPAPDRRRSGRLELVSPQTDLQKTIAEVWRGVLHLEEVGIHDSFFELGGSSLTLFEAYTRLNRILDRKLNLLDLMHRPTVASLAAYLSASSDGEGDAGDGAAEDRGGTLKAGEDRLRRQLERLRQMPR